MKRRLKKKSGKSDALKGSAEKVDIIFKRKRSIYLIYKHLNSSINLCAVYLNLRRFTAHTTRTYQISNFVTSAIFSKNSTPSFSYYFGFYLVLVHM